MKRKVATLDVYVDPDSDSPSGTGQRGAGQFQITINKGSENPIRTVRDFRTILAHELGHFVSLLTSDPTHDIANKALYALTGDSSSLLPAERKAWELANEMLPDIDRELERRCLHTYERNAWRNEIPRTCEPIPSGLPGVCPDDPRPMDEAKLARLRAMYWKAEQAKLDHKAHVWEWSILAVIFGLYWIAGLLNMGIR